ncbi:chitobiosyldiphosphodolichol beta-mannosyltransferase isoform X2 [Prorops nasuta]|uniref:chitobiosyldiphosphodolichol beta-mannosyltransferase isoform X2 n=1 Tax=Prorops nasuta TaxID=863751 RepID=UPI0034CE4032
MSTLYVLCVLFVILAVIRAVWLLKRKKRKSVCILVLGDIGRSPRMQYHALSFAREGFAVNLIGYPGSLPLEELKGNPLITIHYLALPPKLEGYLPKMLNYVVKVVWQLFTLLVALFSSQPSAYLMIQNPPAVPTIPISWFYCTITFTQFIIDWHNYAHTLMALNLRKNHILVRIAYFIEFYFGSKAHQNLCVTQAMKKDLEKQWSIKAKVLYDRPANNFHPITLREKHEFLLRLGKKYDIFKGSTPDSTLFTTCLEGEVTLSQDRPGFIISSTSWTEDEDFSILLNALQEYENNCKENNLKLPKLLCVITGKGPLKEFHKAIIKLKKWNYVQIVTPWLENEEYPKMLACADLGICLHTSSSGLDLPMKVVDMFGCGLPVCAYNFKCLPELVKHEENSLIFSDEKELSEQLLFWFKKFPNNKKQQITDEKFRKNLIVFQNTGWHEYKLIKKLIFEMTDKEIVVDDNKSKLHIRANNCPIIGVLAQEISYYLKSKYTGYTSYIPASYVKFVEGAGARVVPIWIGRNKNYYESILSRINGVLLPGGGAYFFTANGYYEAGQHIYEIAKQFNDNGDYFPIFGICLGFELLGILETGYECRSPCHNNDVVPLKFKKDYKLSRMFNKAPDDVINILKNENVTANHHRLCFTSLENFPNFRILSWNLDSNRTTYISSMEHKTYPFYGVQFHPEKNIYEWKETKNYPHSKSAVTVSQYFANFFIDEARKNYHNFENPINSLIYNFPTTYTRLKSSMYEQCYLFQW